MIEQDAPDPTQDKTTMITTVSCPAMYGDALTIQDQDYHDSRNLLQKINVATRLQFTYAHDVPTLYYNSRLSLIEIV